MSTWATAKSLQATLLALVVLVVFICSLYLRTRSMRTFWDRSCNGAAWRQRFPDSSKDQIREYLEIFARSFAFDLKHGLKFHPDDGIFGVYRTLYPSHGEPDCLELESLAQLISKRYQVDLNSIWRENLTLGDLYAMVQAQNA